MLRRPLRQPSKPVVGICLRGAYDTGMDIHQVPAVRTFAPMIALAVLLCACSSSPQLPASGTAHLYTDSGGQPRSFWIHIPAPPAATPRPLLIVLHGTDSSGETMLARGHFVEHANAEHTIVVAPDALGHAFNDGSGRIGATLMATDDVAFLDRLVAVVRSQLAIDAVFVTGFDSGAAMAQRFALESQATISGVAAVAGHVWPPLIERARATNRSLSVLLLFGNDDPQNPRDGGTVDYGNGLVLTTPSPLATASAFAQLLQCTTQLGATATIIQSTSWHACRNHTQVQLLQVDGLGHHWPGGEPTALPPDIVGPYEGRLRATDAIWRFFNQNKPATRTN